jgi:hypothetical protein
MLIFIPMLDVYTPLSERLSRQSMTTKRCALYVVPGENIFNKQMIRVCLCIDMIACNVFCSVHIYCPCLKEMPC